MTLLVLDPKLAERLKAERRRTGADRFDEIWDGIYIIAPLPDNEHQHLATSLGAILFAVVERPGGGDVRIGINVSDREAGWEHNCRIPDVAVLPPGGPARNLGTHWCGGPDLIIEITGPHDRTREKLAFYGQIGARELLLIDRAPWALELYRPRGGQLVEGGHTDLATPAVLTSLVVPLTFSLLPDDPRPLIEVIHGASGQHWLI
jgi:Uma2 family endonuclease